MEIFAIFGATVGALIVISGLSERKRTKQIREWAADHGWTVEKRPPPSGWAARLPGGYGHGVSLLLSGTVDGRPVAVADYAYSARDSDGEETAYNYVVTAVRFDRRYPPIAVVSRGAFSRLGRRMFGDNAAATGHVDFDRRFRVVTQDPELSRALLGPALIAAHLADRIPEWSLADHDLLAWEPGRIKDGDHIETRVTALLRVADLLGR
ncbi:hypothetical protein [Herbidospora mongoliensis]|uniref:hypothetical protein n=1 Tax=Herbidospora mongoliensis TaxID=688067 RepID=UPI0008347DB4|nr:hypothetical protein [Herbidospora mongoliensis]